MRLSTFLSAAFISMGLVAPVNQAIAQKYPTRTVPIVVTAAVFALWKWIAVFSKRRKSVRLSPPAKKAARRTEQPRRTSAQARRLSADLTGSDLADRAATDLGLSAAIATVELRTHPSPGDRRTTKQGTARTALRDADNRCVATIAAVGAHQT